MMDTDGRTFIRLIPGFPVSYGLLGMWRLESERKPTLPELRSGSRGALR
jgi:hypothetical protein